ncbi:MAG: glycosyltransferase [Aquamicrobium sp.]|uniref:glycosyltransferase family 2 protein n=1 Tax=Mesorhizobium sp. Pch-S TaxID=2082387 RepID=UPI00101163B9|nr:glycosyltransferase family 2 protein [Mesorhizobium sp. Pch-S]MBR2688979.1 glycosyltransferase [Aquamicrobium sp.]QAZ44418.1 N-acetylglucosaminyltransferase [Mesorhizobium sp. Pch-S]
MTACTTSETRGLRLSQKPLLAPVLRGYRRAEYFVGVTLWLAALLYFWIWWFKPSHHFSLFGSALTTYELAWITLMPVYLIVVFAGARQSVGPLRIPAGSRVAMVVTKAPSEPFSIVAETLRAMLAQTVPHDTWLADEDPSPAVIDWCRRHGVFVSTRRGRADYHRATWPRRTRCKEGNLAFFYDHYGYDRYDFVSQLDADHVPEPDYLWNMLRPFADPSIGYVSAPSICDRNARQSWSARGRLYAEASLHGAMQVGHNAGLAPLCFGSHYAVRTAALKEIGGLGPELAEDHSTTLMMNAHGWRGIHAVNAIAHGDGPSTFADLVTQEFQWSRSLVTLLLQHSPIYVPHLPRRLQFQFLFSQLWYPLFSSLMALMVATPVIALLRDENFVAVTYPDFLMHFLPQWLVLIGLCFRWRAAGCFRPVDAKIWSWESAFFLLARWPWALAGSVSALRDWMTGTFVEFRVTPKGTSEVDPLPFRVYAPYVAIAVGSALPALLIDDANAGRGFYLFAIINSVFYTLLTVVILARHGRENRLRTVSRFYRPAVTAGVLSMIALPAFAAVLHGRESVEVLAWGTQHLQLFEERYSAAGAGIGRTEVRKTVFRPHWRWAIEDTTE